MRPILTMSTSCLIAMVLAFSPASSYAEPEKKPRDPLLGTWKLRVKDGALTATLLLTFSADGTGILYTFSPEDKSEKEGALLASGFSFEVVKTKGETKEDVLTLSNCVGIPDKKVTIMFSCDGTTLVLKDGMALRVTDKRGGIEMAGKWVHPAVHPFRNITVAPGAAFIARED